jgi:hypothetical protein
MTVVLSYSNMLYSLAGSKLDHLGLCKYTLWCLLMTELPNEAFSEHIPIKQGMAILEPSLSNWLFEDSLLVTITILS